MKSITYILFVLLALSGCSRKAEVNQNLSRQIVSLDTYTQVLNDSYVNFEITDEVPKNEMHLVGNQKLIDAMEYNIKDQTLILSTKKSVTIKNGEHITARINNSQLSKIQVEGAGTIQSKLIQTRPTLDIILGGAGNINLEVANELTNIEISGVGNLVVKGKTIELNSQIDGAGNLDAFDLEAEQGKHEISGVGNAKVWSTRSLDVKISGIGNLSYKNVADLRVNSVIDGLGKVRAVR